MLPLSKTPKPELKPVPDPEVSDRPRRRKFTAQYKLAVLRELDACTEPGQIGAVLRREGLYSSHVTNWRRAREAGELQGLAPKKHGRPRKPRNPLQPENDRLRRENDRLQEELRKANVIIDVQKKLSTLLGISLPESDGNDG